MSDRTRRVMPKEIRQKINHYTAKERIEGSRWRSGVGRRRYYQMANDNWYIFFIHSTGKLKTIQRPEGEPFGYGGMVRHVHRHR